MKAISLLAIVVVVALASAAARARSQARHPSGDQDEKRTLDVYARGSEPCRWSSGFTAAAGRRATRPTSSSSRRRSWTRGSSSSPPTTGSCRTWTWATIVRDVAKSIRWVHDHIAEYGGDPKRLLVMGHSAGAQLAALVCTDDRYLKAEGLSLAIIKGCVPVDGDTYDVPAIIETAETRWRVHGLPQAKFGHREKFGNDPAKHRDFSAVTHVAKDKGIPPFLILHVADHPDTTAQAQRLGNVLKEAGVPVTRLRRQGDHPQQDQRGPRPARRPGHEGAVRVRRRGVKRGIRAPTILRPFCGRTRILPRRLHPHDHHAKPRNPKAARRADEEGGYATADDVVRVALETLNQAEAAQPLEDLDPETLATIERASGRSRRGLAGQHSVRATPPQTFRRRHGGPCRHRTIGSSSWTTGKLIVAPQAGLDLLPRDCGIRLGVGRGQPSFQLLRVPLGNGKCLHVVGNAVPQPADEVKAVRYAQELDVRFGQR